MSNVSRPWYVSSLPVCSFFLLLLTGLSAPAAHAQATTVTPLDRQLARLDLGITAVGQLTGDVTGTNYLNQTVTQKASTTVGVLVSLRYTKSPFLGFEANYAQARYTENYSNNVPGGVQTKAAEYTLGYVAHLRDIFGLKPYAAVGLGSTAFTPTAGGGQGLPEQARMTYYYNVGVDAQVLSHIGLRAGARQTFFKAPDFGQNYLTINKQTSTFEPTIGIYLKY